jgi:hypothetical protein
MGSLGDDGHRQIYKTSQDKALAFIVWLKSWPIRELYFVMSGRQPSSIPHSFKKIVKNLATTKKRYNDTAIQEPEPGTGTWNRA